MHLPSRFLSRRPLSSLWAISATAALLIAAPGCPGDDGTASPEAEPASSPEDGGNTEPEDAGPGEPAAEPAAEPGDAGEPEVPVDAGPQDAGPQDAGTPDAGAPDGGALDAGPIGETAVLVDVIGWGSVVVSEGEIKVGDSVVPIIGGRAELLDFPAGALKGVVRAPGFAPANVFATVVTGQTTIAQVLLLPVGTTVDFPADERVSLNHENIGVQLPENAFVDAAGNPVTGVITAHLTAFNPLTDMPAAPGPFRGIDSTGSTELIESFGMGEFTFTQNGEELQLAPGMNATVRIGIPPSLGADIGSFIPSWSYDLEEGRWVEEEMGSVFSTGDRLQWEANVTHFTWWNVDRTTVDKECVRIQIDGDDLGAGIPVYSDGVDYAGVDVSATNESGEGCVEFKRGASAQIHAGSGSHGFNYTLNVVGSGEPADCEGNGAGCSTILIEVPQLTCVRGNVTEGGLPKEDADAFLEYGRSVSVKRTDANGNYCAQVPLSTSIHAVASVIDATGSLLIADAFTTSGGTEASCAEPLTCTDVGTLELSTPPQYCVEGEAQHIEGISGLTDSVPVGAALYAFRTSTFTGVNCSQTPEQWGSVIGTGTVGMNGGYCLNLPLGENTRDVTFAVDRCGQEACETELPDSSCGADATFTLTPGDEQTAAGGQCFGAGTCVSNDFVLAL